MNMSINQSSAKSQQAAELEKERQEELALEQSRRDNEKHAHELEEQTQECNNSAKLEEQNEAFDAKKQIEDEEFVDKQHDDNRAYDDQKHFDDKRRDEEARRNEERFERDREARGEDRDNDKTDEKDTDIDKSATVQNKQQKTEKGAERSSDAASGGAPSSFADAKSQSAAAGSVASDRERRNEKFERDQKDYDRRIDMSKSPVDKERLTYEKDLAKHSHLSEQKSWLLGQGSSAIGDNKELRATLKNDIEGHNKEADQLRKKLEPENHAYHRTSEMVDKQRLENAERGVSGASQQTRDRVAERQQALQKVQEKTQEKEQSKASTQQSKIDQHEPSKGTAKQEKEEPQEQVQQQKQQQLEQQQPAPPPPEQQQQQQPELTR